MTNLYTKYKEMKQKISDLGNTLAVMHWDQEVNMPEKGAHFRAQQISTLSGIVHELSTSAELEETLLALEKEKNLSFEQKRNVEESLRILRKDKKLNKDFVVKFSKAVSEAYQSWLQAKAESKFSIFAPKLNEIVELSKHKAEMLGYKDHPYDALMEDYEPGLTTAHVQKVFEDVKIQLGIFFEKIKDKPQPDDSILEGNFDKDKQFELSKKIVADLGYDFEAGRLDLSPHPFSTGFNPQDVRITTRINENQLSESIWGAIHETGHALYEQGLKPEEYGLPSGEPVSLSIHESQSRLWENNVGKSWTYMNAYWPLFQQYFPENFANKNAEDFFKAINKVQPNLIRIDADEVTYHFHVLLRFEIEKALIEGSAKIDDLEELWNSKIKEYLGLDVPSASQGVLQDIHWSHGSFGYFPTYSLGSFYAAQFYHAAQKAIPDLETQIAGKNFSSLLRWLRENIHQYGHLYSSEELCHKVTGEGLNYKYFNDYLYQKYTKVYDL